MKQATRQVGVIALTLAGVDLAILHLLPPPLLHTTAGTLSATLVLRHRPLRREAVLLTVAGIALLLLVFFPADLADMTTDAVTCGQQARIEPCTLAGRVHNPLSTLVFAPIFPVILSVCARSFRDDKWRGAARFSVVCGALVIVAILGSYLYLHSIGWQGRNWTGLTQRSLVFPALLWMVGLLAGMERPTPEIASV